MEATADEFILEIDDEGPARIPLTAELASLVRSQLDPAYAKYLERKNAYISRIYSEVVQDRFVMGETVQGFLDGDGKLQFCDEPMPSDHGPSVVVTAIDPISKTLTLSAPQQVKC